MADEKLELKPEELGQAAGGEYHGSFKPIFNSDSKKIGTHDLIDDIIYYTPCNLCKKPMYTGGTGYCCSACRTRLVWVKTAVWNGTEEELIAAAD